MGSLNAWTPRILRLTCLDTVHTGSTFCTVPVHSVHARRVTYTTRRSPVEGSSSSFYLSLNCIGGDIRDSDEIRQILDGEVCLFCFISIHHDPDWFKQVWSHTGGCGSRDSAGQVWAEISLTESTSHLSWTQTSQLRLTESRWRW